MINFADLRINQEVSTNCDAKNHIKGDQKWPCLVTGLYHSEYGDKYHTLTMKNDQNSCRCRRRNDEMEVRRGWVHFLQSSFNARLATTDNLLKRNYTSNKPDKIRY